MEHLGGLIHRMPQTAFVFLVGCVAISALPPLNGFVSEWLTFQAILLSPQLPSWGLKFLVPAVGALLALSASLAAACFVKAFGISFLGRPRASAAANARETDGLSLAAMFLLAALCLVAGIFPGVFIDALAPVSKVLVGRSMPHQIGIEWVRGQKQRSQADKRGQRASQTVSRQVNFFKRGGCPRQRDAASKATSFHHDGNQCRRQRLRAMHAQLPS